MRATDHRCAKCKGWLNEDRGCDACDSNGSLKRVVMRRTTVYVRGCAAMTPAAWYKPEMPCRHAAIGGSLYCMKHQPKELRDRCVFGIAEGADQRCKKKATWMTCFHGKNSMMVWCDEHKPECQYPHENKPHNQKDQP